MPQQRIPMFFVINKNPKTRNPCTNVTYAGQYVERGGFQVKDVQYATPYWTRKGAIALVNRLTKAGGQQAPHWATSVGFAPNVGDRAPEYEIIEGALIIDV